MCVVCTTSVTLTGEYINLQWFPNGPSKFTFQVGGVAVSEPNDYTVEVTKLTDFETANALCLNMDFNNLKYMPANYTPFFPSIQYLIVRNAHVKYVTNADFLGLKDLYYVDFESNEIEHLPGNLFQGVSKTLASVSFIGNKIRNVGPNFIANIPQLKTLLMKGNQCVYLNSPATFNTFTTTFKTKCQKPIIPEVVTNPPPTFEEHDALNTRTNDLMIKNTNLSDEIKLKKEKVKELERDIKDKNQLVLDLDKCILSTEKLQTELTDVKNSIQAIESSNVMTIKTE